MKGRTLRLDGNYPVRLVFRAPGGLRVEAHIAKDMESRPFWLGALSSQRAPQGIRCGELWLIPHVSTREQEAAARNQFGRGPKRKDGRKSVRERAKEDALRIKDYGQGWFLYRLTVIVFQGDSSLGLEEMAGLGEHSLPLGGELRLIEELASDIIERSKARALGF